MFDFKFHMVINRIGKNTYIVKDLTQYFGCTKSCKVLCEVSRNVLVNHNLSTVLFDEN